MDTDNTPGLDRDTAATHKADLEALNQIEGVIPAGWGGPLGRIKARMSILHETEAALGGRKDVRQRRLYVVYIRHAKDGVRRPVHWCASPATADRLAKAAMEFANEAEVQLMRAYDIGLGVYAPVALALPTPEDRETDARQRKRNDLIARMHEAGFTAEDIKLAAGGAS